jgi:hypothetical protein
MLSKSGFPLSRYWRPCLSKHVFDTDANGHPLGEKLNSLIVIPAKAGKFMINFTRPKVESEALIQKINF